MDYEKTAQEFYRKAEKSLKTGFFKWSPDYEIAAHDYNEAAKAYRNAKLPNKFIEATLKAAQCYLQSRSFYTAAKNYEQVALTYKDQNDWDSMVTYLEKACQLYRENSTPDTAALTYNRGAGMLEAVKPEKAAQWYGLSSETVLLEDRYLQAAEYANKAVRMYLKLKQYDNAVQWAEKALECYSMAGENRNVGRQVCTLVIIHLARNDSISAQKIYISNKGSVEYDERYVLDSLFDGLDSFDNAAIYAALKTPFIQNLENEVTKVIRDLLVKYEPKKIVADETAQSTVDEYVDEEAGAML